MEPLIKWEEHLVRLRRSGYNRRFCMAAKVPLIKCPSHLISGSLPPGAALIARWPGQKMLQFHPDQADVIPELVLRRIILGLRQQGLEQLFRGSTAAGQSNRPPALPPRRCHR
jgi:hypothetical protein